MESINNKYHIDFNNEYLFWSNFIINKWIQIDYICPSCKKKSMKIKKNSKSILNPIKLKCSYNKCRKSVNIRDKTFFGLYPKTPISVIIKIIEYFLIDGKNCQEIKNNLIIFYSLNSLNEKLIYSIVNSIRKYISHYLKEIYLEKMVEENKNAFIAIDESLFSHTIDNEQIWLVGLIDTNTKYFRIEAVKERDTETMERIICHHIGKGNNIITDGWGSYNWLDNPRFGYRRIIHIHGLHDFGFGNESTSYIESVWSDLKRLLSKIYNAVKPTNFLYFAK